jgi:hypothetical protein
MIREWRYLKMLKRAGRGHDPAGVQATKAGELAVLCPACPQPGINLPEGWEKASWLAQYVWHLYSMLLDLRIAFRWLYCLFLAIDANFRLQWGIVSSMNFDPGLAHGLSYFVRESEYKEYLKPRMDIPQEVCSKCIYVLFNC